ncbi:MAG: hypothetical protein WAX57_02550 [Minisyncoccia bacterium]
MKMMRFVRAKILGALFLLVFFLPASSSAAEDTLSVTVTPPLFQLTIGPGESWTSMLKIVNNNTYDVTYYASPMDFEADGEQGKGRFMPLVEDRNSSTSAKATLGYWVDISPDPIVIPRGTSGEIPFTVTIPPNASPGGHYAAILVGTKPGEEEISGPAMRISSFVSSLLFVRIKGDVIERARIREFLSSKRLYETPKADFLLRFENTGNTHLKPQGDIVLYNMWGKERGKVAINQANNFGNVLPDTIRKFEFSWKGEGTALDIGRYSAVVTLSYGEDNKQILTARTYFWVVPLIPVGTVIAILAFFLLSLAWLIRRYVRRALAIEKSRLGIAETPRTSAPTLSIETFIEPLREGVVDLRSVGRARIPEVTQRVFHEAPQLTLFGFLQKYSLFFFFLALLVAGGMGLWMYFDNVLLPERPYEISDVTSEEEYMNRE